MFLSIFDIFKVGVGPSSSIQWAQWWRRVVFGSTAGTRYQTRQHRRIPSRITGLHGQGASHRLRNDHGAGRFKPDTFDANTAEAALEEITKSGKIQPDGHPEYLFNPKTAVRFDYDRVLDGHANGMVLYAYDSIGTVLFQETYYSIGGGFVQTASELASNLPSVDQGNPAPFPFKTANAMLEMSANSGKTIAQMKWDNELANMSATDLTNGINKIWDVMNNCIEQGLKKDGILPGGLSVKRRAKGIHESLRAEQSRNIAAPHIINDWMSCYAMAVNEQNAAGAQVVTAPTNGAAGVIPATLRYYLDHVPDASMRKIPDFLLTAAAVGGLIKTNASISGAEVGCQGEVGSAAAMAAAGLCAVSGRHIVPNRSKTPPKSHWNTIWA